MAAVVSLSRGQRGKIFFVDANDSQVEQPTLFADLTSRVSYKDRENEEGLVGLAFHPAFKTNGYFRFYTTRERPHVSVISRFSSKDGNEADLGSELSCLKFNNLWNHNGGTIQFGPDGYLYVALGDGGKDDPLGSGQDVSTLLGSILRLDVNQASANQPYTIPASNPFAEKSSTFRDLRFGSVISHVRYSTQNRRSRLRTLDDWEEINLISAGGNYWLESA